MTFFEPLWQFFKAAYGNLLNAASLVAVWEATRAIFRVLRDWVPVRRVLGPLCRSDNRTLIFVKHLQTPVQDNKYLFKVPDFFPPQTTGKAQLAINIPSVIAKADSTAVGDFLNALGQVGRHEGIEVVDPVTHWQNWDDIVVCVGGSFKSDQVWKKCQPLPVVLDGADFKIVPTGERLQAVQSQDFGLLCKTKNPDSGRDLWLIIGLGAYGTEAAGYFLRTNLSTLGKMFGSAPFSVIVRTSLTEGGRQASFWWASPQVKLWRQLLYRKTYKRFQRQRESVPRTAGLTFGQGGHSNATTSVTYPKPRE